MGVVVSSSDIICFITLKMDSEELEHTSSLIHPTANVPEMVDSIAARSVIPSLRNINRGRIKQGTALKHLNFGKLQTYINSQADLDVRQSSQKRGFYADVLQRWWRRMMQRRVWLFRMKGKWHESWSQAVFAIILGHRVRKLLKSTPMSKLVAAYQDSLYVLLDLLKMSYDGNDKMELLTSLEKVCFDGDQLHRALRSFHSLSFADQTLVKSLVKQLVISKSKFHSAFFCNSVYWRHPAPGFWDLSFAVVQCAVASGRELRGIVTSGGYSKRGSASLVSRGDMDGNNSDAAVSGSGVASLHRTGTTTSTVASNAGHSDHRSNDASSVVVRVPPSSPPTLLPARLASDYSPSGVLNGASRVRNGYNKQVSQSDHKLGFNTAALKKGFEMLGPDERGSRRYSMEDSSGVAWGQSLSLNIKNNRPSSVNSNATLLSDDVDVHRKIISCGGGAAERNGKPVIQLDVICGERLMPSRKVHSAFLCPVESALLSIAFVVARCF